MHAGTLAKLRARSTATLTSPAVPLNLEQSAARAEVLAAYETGEYAVEPVGCLCGEERGLEVVSRDRYGFPAPSLLCRRCGIVRSTPRLTTHSLESFYNRHYRRLYDGTARATEKFFAQQTFLGRRILRYARGVLPPDGVVADVGCGAGGMLLPFRAAGYDVVGCDLSSSYLDFGRSEGLDLRHGDLRALAERGPFDLVILSHVFEHIPDPIAFATNLRSLVKRDGVAYVEVPGLRNIPREYGDPLRYFQNAHLWNFDLATLRTTLARCGFELVRGDERIRSLFRPGHPVEASQANGPSALATSLARAERLAAISDPVRRFRSQPWFPTPARLEKAILRVAGA